MLKYPLPYELPQALSPEVLLANLAWVINERQRDLYEGLLSPAFTFVDETTTPPLRLGRAAEAALVVGVFRTHKDIEFSLTVSSRRDAVGGCEVIYGESEAVATTRSQRKYVRDAVRLTACEGTDGLWRLAEWRVLSKLASPVGADSNAVLSWGEMKLDVEG